LRLEAHEGAAVEIRPVVSFERAERRILAKLIAACLAVSALLAWLGYQLL
jgi:hypothetical protein